jgi:hypothetical protein
MRKRSALWVGVGVAVLATLGTSAWAEPRILSRYSGGGNYYYNPRSSGGPSGYSGASGAIYRDNSRPAQVRVSGLGFQRKLAAPCGNFNRVPPRHCPPTKAWNPNLTALYLR